MVERKLRYVTLMRKKIEHHHWNLKRNIYHLKRRIFNNLFENLFKIKKKHIFLWFGQYEAFQKTILLGTIIWSKSTFNWQCQGNYHKYSKENSRRWLRKLGINQSVDGHHPSSYLNIYSLTTIRISSILVIWCKEKINKQRFDTQVTFNTVPNICFCKLSF